MPFYVLTLNFRRSSYKVGPQWPERKPALFATLRAIPTGLPDVILAQECTKEQQLDTCRELGYEAFGNGVKPLTALDRDRSGDNVPVLYSPRTMERVSQRIYWAGVADNVGRTYVRVLQLRHKATGETYWVASVHPPAGGSLRALRVTHIRKLAEMMRAGGVDFSRLIWGGDFNDAAPFSEPGIRAELSTFGLKDLRRTLPASSIEGEEMATSHHWKPTPTSGRWIDDLLTGGKVPVREAWVVRTDLPIPAKAGTDHNGVLARIGDLVPAKPEPSPARPPGQARRVTAEIRDLLRRKPMSLDPKSRQYFEVSLAKFNRARRGRYLSRYVYVVEQWLSRPVVDGRWSADDQRAYDAFRRANGFDTDIPPANGSLRALARAASKRTGRPTYRVVA